MGSGKLIRAAIEKYSEDCFSKDILFVFDNEDEMNAKEAELVTEKFCRLNSNYNLCPGGHGGFGYINGDEIKRKAKNKKAAIAMNLVLNSDPVQIERRRKQLSEYMKERHKSGNFKYDTFKGKKHSEETKLKMSIAAKNRKKKN